MVDVFDDAEEHRFEAHLDGEVVGCIDYTVEGNVTALIHTIVPSQYEGNGIASALAKFALDQARAKGTLIKPQCSFIAGYVNRHPEYLDVVARR